MNYNLFLFDLDDTLLDFSASEKLSFFKAMESLNVKCNLEAVFQDYQIFNEALWRKFEQAEVTKDFLKVERFRQTFSQNKIEMDAELASLRYLEALPETVVVMEGARELCESMTKFGELGIITNGIEQVQNQRIRNSGLKDYFSFVSVSDEIGVAKPNPLFFEHTVKKARSFLQEKTVIIGDRIDADILGAHNFGIDSCWFNPYQKLNESEVVPTYEVRHLSEIIPKLIAKNRMLIT